MSHPAGVFLGIDLGGTKIEGVVLDAQMRPVERRRVPTERERGYDHILDRVADLVPPKPPRVTRLAQGPLDEAGTSVTDPLAPDRVG